MNREPLYLRVLGAPMDERFHTVQSAEGLPQIVEADETGVCRFVALPQVGAAILRYVTNKVQDEAYAWTARMARDCADFWHSFTTKHVQPAPLLWADEEGLCFHRLPWRRADTKPELPEAWASTLARMSNAEAFVVWVGSLFDPRADLQQYVWLYGQGDNGKGTILRFFEKAMGPSFASQQPPSKDDKFWTYGLRDKRLVVFADCNNTTFVSSGLFKSLTGGDAIRIEGKGKDATTARLSCKFLFASNDRPTLSSERADMRRAIFCDVGPIVGKPDPAFESLLWDAGGDFLAYCMERYRAQCPVGGRIGCVESGALDEWVSAVEEPLEVAFSTAFTVHKIPDNGAWRDLPYITSKEFQDVIERFFGRDSRSARDFRTYCERKHNLVGRVVKLKENITERRYIGVSMKPGWNLY